MITRVRNITIILFVVLLVMLCYLQYGRKESVKASYSTTYSGKTSEYLSIVANKLYIRDKEAYGRYLIDKCVEDNVNGISFSYDMGYPVEINLEIYTNEFMRKQNKWCCAVRYTQDPEEGFIYNVKDNPEKFIMTVRYPVREIQAEEEYQEQEEE